MWLIYAFGSAIAAGVTAILAKIGIRNVSSNVATALRTVVILIFAWLMVFITGAYKGIGNISTYAMIFLILSGIATGASWLCYFKALQLGDVNKVTPIDKSSTVLTIILAFIFLGEDITWIKAVCVVLIGVGTYLMIEKKKVHTEQINSKDEGVKNRNENTGKIVNIVHSSDKTVFKAGGKWVVYAVLSAVFASLTSILGKIGISGVDSNLGTAIRTIVVLVMAWVVVFVTKEQKKVRQVDRKSALFIALSGITTGVSWLCYYKALQSGPASVVLPIDKLSILVTIFFSWAVLKEKLSVKALIGLIMITAGTLMMLY